MKRFSCLLLCFLLLFCCACKKEEDPKPELGTGYISGGHIYNTHIRMRLVTQELKPPAKVAKELRAPVERITVEIQNDTDHYVNLLKLAEWRCEKWENGEWITVPAAYVYVDRDISQSAKYEYDWVEPQSTRTVTIPFVPDDPSSAGAIKNAQPIMEGVYRLKHSVFLTKEQLPGGSEYTVEVYFTVAPLLG